MCSGGGGGGASGFNSQAQVAAQQQASADQLAEQQREFDIQTQQANQTLANTKALQDKQQAEADQQAALTSQWETGRAAETTKATNTVNDAFAQFTPDYYAGFTKAYTDHFDPQVDQQAGLKSNATLFGLARSGNLQSQTAANQIAQNATDVATAKEDINNQAIGATTQERNQVLSAQQNLTAQATSDATLGSPITPGSADAITANFNNTSNALARIGSQAGDVVTSLAATPNYGSLGNLFGAAASGVGGAISGNNLYNYGQNFNAGLSGASNPISTSSGGVSR